MPLKIKHKCAYAEDGEATLHSIADAIWSFNMYVQNAICNQLLIFALLLTLIKSLCFQLKWHRANLC